MATRNTKNKTETESTNIEASEIKTEEIKKPTRVKNTRKKKEKIPGDTLVDVQNITMGKLIYISSRQNGFKVTWSNPGDIEEIELSELMTMRNSQPRFFTNNWIKVDDDILRYLGMEKYYKNVPSFEDFDDIFNLPLDEMKVAISNLPAGMKDTFSFKASELINSGEIDSVKVVKYLCEVFNLIPDEE